MDLTRFAKLFDHSIVRPDATRAEIMLFADTAARLGTATLTVQPHYIQLAATLLRGSDVLVGTVVGFPHGNETPAMKVYQANEVLDLGAEEIDMVMNIPALKNGEERLFIRDVEGVVRAAEGKTVKVITENCYLTQEEKRRACEWIAQAGARFVKIRQIDQVLRYLQAGARRFGSTRTEQFVRAFEDLSADARAGFIEYLPRLASGSAATGAA